MTSVTINPPARIPRAMPVDEWRMGTSPHKSEQKRTYGLCLWGLRGRGFTFIEILIVTVVIGILAGVSLPQLKRAFDTITLENFVKDIYYLCRYLQAASVAEAKVYYLGIKKEEGYLQAAVQEEGQLKTIAGRFGRPYKAPVQVFILVEPSDKEGIYFYPDATSDDITLIAEKAKAGRISLVVKGVTGEIKIQ